MAPPDATARKRVYDMVWGYPGLHMRQVARLLEYDPSLVEYHLNQLQKQGLITSFDLGGYRRFFPLASDAPPLTHEERRILGLLRQEMLFAVVMLLLERGSAQNTELASLLGLSKATLTYHLKILVKAGIVRKTPRGEQRGFQLEDPERIRVLLRRYRPAPDLVDEYSRMWDEAFSADRGPPPGSEDAAERPP